MDSARIPQARSRLEVYLERLAEMGDAPLDLDTLARLVRAERAARAEWGQSAPRRARNLRPVYRGEG